MNDGTCIRPYEASDVEDLVAAVRESFGELWPWMPWCSPAYSASNAAAWVRTTQDGHAIGSMHEFAVIDPNGRYAGGCGINQINATNGVANLGYWIRSSATGRGIAPAAVRRVAAWAFEHTTLNRLEILVAVGNVRSLRVAEKAGAEREGVLRKRLIVDGRPLDAIIHSLVRPDS